MSYYSFFGLLRDPFVNTPDPSLFFHCPKHVALLDQLEVSIRLCRGLSVALGPVGTGKTMLSRQLQQSLAANPLFEVHLLQDPFFENEKELMLWLNREFDLPASKAGSTARTLKKSLQDYLLGLATEKKRIAVLLIDEGQRITKECLESLRELLNSETKDGKLLQMVIFAQDELSETLKDMHNLQDRIYQTLRLSSFTFNETLGLINTRIALCKGDSKNEPLFSTMAVMAVHMASRGFPRQVVLLCHKAMLSAITSENMNISWGMVWSCTNMGKSPIRRFKLDLAMLFIVGLVGGYLLAEYGPIHNLVMRALELLPAFPHAVA